MAMEPGAFDGTITITERQPAAGFTSLFSKHTPAWPVKVPVTFIVIPERLEDPLDTTPTIPEENEEDDSEEEEESGGLAVEVQLRSPQDVTVDAAGNLYIADAINHLIRRVDPSGTITTIAGTGEPGFAGDGGSAVVSQIHYPQSVAVDAAGNLFFTEYFRNRIRRVDSSGTISTFAGTGEGGFSGDGGPAVQALLDRPRGLAVDMAGNLYIADSSNECIRRVDSSGTISTFAGTGEGGFSGDGGSAVQALLDRPRGLAVDMAGNLYIADSSNECIRRVDSSGIISTFAGRGARLGEVGPVVKILVSIPPGVEVDADGNLFITEAGRGRILRVDTSGTISTIAGTDSSGFGGDGGPAIKAHLHAPSDIAVDTAGNLFIADTNKHRIRRVDPSGIITTIAGTGERGFAGDGGLGVEAQLNYPEGVAVDAAGNLYFADSYNHRIRRVDPSGTISTIVGTREPLL